MTFMSTIGTPFTRNPKQLWRKGETLGGFTLPFHVFGSLDTLFRRFSLWESSNGVLVPGLRHEPFKHGLGKVLSTSPVLVGDFVEEQVIFSKNVFNHRLGLWECDVIEGDLPDLECMKERFDLLEEIVFLDKISNEKMISLITDLFERVLPLCQDSNGVPLMTQPARAVFETLKRGTEEELGSCNDRAKDLLWM